MKKINSFEAELSEQEQQIIWSIKDGLIPEVSQDEIKRICKVAASYYTEKQSVWNVDFWNVIFSCLTIKSAFFWLLSAFLLGSCVVVSLLINRFEIEPLSVMTALSPIPMLTFVIRELQYRDHHLVQLEKTCKYAPAKIYFARLWIGMIFNALFIAFAGMIAFSGYENLLQLYLFAFAVMFFMGAIALFFMSFTDNALPLSLLMVVWVLGAICLLGQEEILTAILGISISIFIVGFICSLGLFAFATTKHTIKLYA